MLRTSLAVLAVVAIAIPAANRYRHPTTRSGPILPAPLASSAVTLSGPQTVVFAGGCFWGVEAVFEHLKGVIDVVSGYAGGSAETANYETVGNGQTGHAESVEVKYDPSQITYGQLLQVFFSVAHDPTELNRQGPDVGPQYRSAIFFVDAEQERLAKSYIDQLTSEKAFSRPIVTEVVALQKFFPAEEYHQNYMERNPNQLYIVVHDRPKVERLKREFPALWRGR